VGRITVRAQPTSTNPHEIRENLMMPFTRAQLENGLGGRQNLLLHWKCRLTLVVKAAGVIACWTNSARPSRWYGNSEPFAILVFLSALSRSDFGMSTRPASKGRWESRVNSLPLQHLPARKSMGIPRPDPPQSWRDNANRPRGSYGVLLIENEEHRVGFRRCRSRRVGRNLRSQRRFKRS
jgi:hypothetical protein